MTQSEFEIVRQKVNAKYEGQYELVESGFSKIEGPSSRWPEFLGP